MNRSDFIVVSNYFRTLISYKDKVHLELTQPNNSNPIQNIIDQQKEADRIIKDIINGESENLIAQATIYALAFQN